MELTTHFHLVLRLRMSGARPLLLIHASLRARAKTLPFYKEQNVFFPVPFIPLQRARLNPFIRPSVLTHEQTQLPDVLYM
jgi:hypothetical protein